MEQLTNYPSSRTIESPASIEYEGNSAETVVNLPFSTESILTVRDETADLEQMDPLNPKDFHTLSPSILRHGHHPSWLGISSAITPGCCAPLCSGLMAAPKSLRPGYPDLRPCKSVPDRMLPNESLIYVYSYQLN